MTDNDLRVLQQEFLDYTKSEDLTFILDGPIDMTVKILDGTYRVHPLGPDAFFLIGVRTGPTAKWIFEFQFVESNEEAAKYIQVETNSRKIDDRFTGMLVELKRWAARRFSTLAISPVPALYDLETTEELVNVLEEFWVEETENTIETTDRELKQLPNFGMF